MSNTATTLGLRSGLFDRNLSVLAIPAVSIRRLLTLIQPNIHRLTSILLFFVRLKFLDLCRSVLAPHRQGHLARRQVRQREAQGADQLQGHRRFDLQGKDVSRPVSDFRHNDGLTDAELSCRAVFECCSNRLAAIHINGMENFPLFAAAVVSPPPHRPSAYPDS